MYIIIIMCVCVCVCVCACVCVCVCVCVRAGSLPDTDSHEMPRASNDDDDELMLNVLRCQLTY